MKCPKTLEMLTVAFGESTVSRTQVQLWFNRFKASRDDVNDDICPGLSSTSTTVNKLILDNSRINIREDADGVNISFSSCQEIFTDVLGMKPAATMIVPKLLNFEQKQRRIDIAKEMLATFNDDSDGCMAMIMKPVQFC